MIEKIKLGLFDVFTYALPGVLIVFSFALAFDNSNRTLSQFFFNSVSPHLNISNGLFLFIIGYVIGFANDSFGAFILKTSNHLSKKNEFSIFPSMPNSKKYSLIREYSPENFKYVEIWNALKGMSSNLASATIFFISSSIIKAINPDFLFIKEWLVIIMFSIIMMIIFIKKAMVFKKWAKNDLENGIYFLTLKEDIDTKIKFEILKEFKKY